MNGYKKRVLHDQIIPKVVYQDRYFQLKQKYMCWVDQWIEKTDASKHVFEEVGIAAFMTLLFEEDMKLLGRWLPVALYRQILCLDVKFPCVLYRKPRFADLGCGNGFLTYILNKEGFEGVGIDMTARKSWTLFSDEANLRGCGYYL